MGTVSDTGLGHSQIKDWVEVGVEIEHCHSWHTFYERGTDPRSRHSGTKSFELAIRCSTESRGYPCSYLAQHKIDLVRPKPSIQVHLRGWGSCHSRLWSAFYRCELATSIENLEGPVGRIDSWRIGRRWWPNYKIRPRGWCKPVLVWGRPPWFNIFDRDPSLQIVVSTQSLPVDLIQCAS